MTSLSVSVTSSGNANPSNRFLTLVEQGDIALVELKKYYGEHPELDSNTLIRGVALAVRNFQVQTVHYLYLEVMKWEPKFEMVHAVLESAASEGNWQGLNYLLDKTPGISLPQESIDLALARVVEAASPELRAVNQKACIACIDALLDGKKPPSDEAIEHALLGAVFMGNGWSVESLLSSEHIFSWETLVRALKGAAGQGNKRMQTSITKTIKAQQDMLRTGNNQQDREYLESGYQNAMEEIRSIQGQEAIWN